MSGLPELPDEADVRKRQVILIAGLVVVVLLVLAYIYSTSPSMQAGGASNQRPVEIDLSTPGQSADPIQNWVLQNENMLQEFEQRQKAAQEQTDLRIQQLMDEIAKLRQDNEQLEKSLKQTPRGTQGGGAAAPSAAAAPQLPPRSALPPPPRPQTLPLPASSSGPAAPGSAPAAPALVDRVLNADTLPKIVKVKFNRKKNRRAHIRDTIPAGAFGKAVLLSGLDAPTGGMAERHPYPVLLELTDNANLPNRYRHRVKQCRLIGSATGNISDERGYIRLERLTCVLRNGEIISEVATGTVTGEDGKNGLRGRLVSKQGQIIANAFLAGSLSSIGNAVAQSYTTVATTATGTVSTLDPGRVLEAGAAGGLGNSLDKIADWYFKRAEETYPVIEISAGRVVDVFLTEDLKLGANLLSEYTPEHPNDD